MTRQGRKTNGRMKTLQSFALSFLLHIPKLTREYVSVFVCVRARSITDDRS